MKILFHINHPAQYHLFKHVIRQLKNEKHHLLIIARNKDVLTQLLNNDGVDFINTTHRTDRESNIFSLFVNFAIQYTRVKKEIQLFQPDLLLGTSFTLPWISKKLKIPYLNFVEDDADVIPLYSKLSFPRSDYIVAPEVCDLKKWEHKKIGYNGYHELAFLHPTTFQASKEVAGKYLDLNKNNFLIRLTAFNAHHDYGKNGIDTTTLNSLLNILGKNGHIYISSEKPLSSELEKYRLIVNPNDIHHVMNYCKLIIGDSQSMAMEAACLGIPSVRMNDYADRISVLKELEEEYELTHSFSINQKKAFLEKVDFLAQSDDVLQKYQERKTLMIKEKVNVNDFVFWLIKEFPESIKEFKNNPNIRFKYTSSHESLKKYKLKKGNSQRFLIVFILYILLLLGLYLIPMEGEFKLNKYKILSLRLDYIVHVCLFIPTVFIMSPIFLRQTHFRLTKIIGLSLLMGVLFEILHYFVTYRAFTFEDMIANLLGVCIGAIIMLVAKRTT